MILTCRRVAALVAVILSACALLLAPTTKADAQERNLVVFGDSIVANPTVTDYFAGGMSSGPSLGSSGNPLVGCPQGPNWGRSAAAKLGLPVRNYSCSGTVSISRGPQFASQVDRALSDGGLSPATARIIISTGFNDTYNNANLPDGQVRGNFVNAMVPQINRIRAAAPNARIQIVGYPSITEGNNVCLLHIGPNIYERTYYPAINNWQWQAQAMQVDLARATGVEFLDLKPSTRDNHMCATDDKRMWAGLIDFFAGSGSMPLHVNDRGHEHVANVIAAS